MNSWILGGMDYYPFGMVMPGRSYTAGTGYRYGFNGKENDDEVKGNGKQQDYGMRVYDTRIARFLSVDPLSRKFPMLTPYQFASNTPIQSIDLDGNEALYYMAHSDHQGKVVTDKKTFKELFPKSKEDVGPYGSGTAYIAYSTNGNVIFESYSPSVMDQIKNTLEVGGLLEWGNASSSDESVASKTKGRIFGSLDNSELLELFDLIGMTHPEALKSETTKPDVLSVGEKTLDVVSNTKEKNNQDTEDTTIKVATKKNMNSWKDGNTIIEFKDTTVKKKDVDKTQQLHDETK